MIKSLKYIPYLLKQFYHISQFEKWNKEKIEKYQINAFQKIFEKAKQIPFYNELYKDAGVLDAKIGSIEDLKVLPTIDKSLCRSSNYENYFLNKNFSGTMITATSGSTGKPFQIRIPTKIEMVPPIKVIHAMRQFGWRPFYKGLEIWRDDLSTHKGLMKKLGLLKSVSIFKPLNDISAVIQKEKPQYLFCTRTFFIELVDYLSKNNITYKPKFLLCTTEDVDKVHREKLESFFQSKLINVYGCMEAPTIAYTCPEHNKFHVFQTTVIVEVINRRIINGQEFGDVAITNLTNSIMPFIRYKTGDVVRVEKDQCLCERTSQIIGAIQGRSDDVIKYKDGRVLNFHHFYHAFRGVYIVEQYKVIFNRKLEKLQFQFKLRDSSGVEKKINEIGKIVETHFTDYHYDIEILDSFRLAKSGKFKIIELID